MSILVRMLGLSLFLLALGCATESKQVANAEQTARSWQSYIDQNEFDKAKVISTDRAVAMIEMIESILSEGFEEEVLPPTVFLEMDCIEKEKAAVCTYLMESEGENIRDSFLLVREKDRWLVDIPEEDPSLEEEEMQQIFEDFEQIFEEAQEEDEANSETIDNSAQQE